MSDRKNNFDFSRQSWPKQPSAERVVGERGRKELPPGTKGGENMKPDRHAEHKQHAFDSFCKKVLKCEACNVAGWSSGRELAELKASLEIIRSAAHELISALDEHLAELRQQREADLSAAQEAAFALDNGSSLFIQTCDSGYDYTLYGPDNKALDGGQLDAPGLTLPEEALALLGQTAAVSEVILGDKLAAFQEAAEKANELSAPEAEKAVATDLSAEPTVTILWSESDKLQDGEIMPLSVANRVFEELDTAQHTDREKDGYTGGWYDKTAFRIDFTLNGQPDNYEGRQDFGDGEGSLVQHIQNYHEYYAQDENWKNFVLHNKGPEAWEQDKAEHSASGNGTCCSKTRKPTTHGNSAASRPATGSLPMRWS